MRGRTPRVDKHSTGGIGDKVSIVLAPLLVCCGLEVPMISGRGLGATAGTLDKLESIPGFRTDLDATEIERVLDAAGCVITGHDDGHGAGRRKIYALRDVTGTVAVDPPDHRQHSLQEGGRGPRRARLRRQGAAVGSFMKTPARARRAGGFPGGRRRAPTESDVRALLTDMSQPLGRMVGHANEIDESVAALEGDGPDDLMEVTLALGAQLLVAVNAAADESEGRAELGST